MSYFRNTDDDRPLSARDGRSIKDHVEVLHFVVLKQTEAVEKLEQKIKNIEESLEDKSDTSTCDENENVENVENKIPETTPNSRLWKGLWSAGALLTSIGIYLGFSRYKRE
jgi:hypothetical protein